MTESEAQVLSLLTQEFLTVAQIAVRRKTSKRAVQLIRQRLIKKGFLGGASGCEASQGGGVAKVAKHHDGVTKIRLHGMQWKIAVLHSSSWERVQPRIIPDFMGCHVAVEDGRVEIYTKEGVFFDGADEWSAMALALQFFEKLALRLEHDLRITIIKPRAQNWTLVKSEWATEGSEVANRCIGDDIPLKVFAREDGHLWFWGDWSKKTPEHETGGRSAKVDSEEVNKHLNDWRDFHPPTNSQLFGALQRVIELQLQTAEFQKEQAAGLSMVIKLMTPPQPTELPPEAKSSGRPWYVG